MIRRCLVAAPSWVGFRTRVGVCAVSICAFIGWSGSRLLHPAPMELRLLVTADHGAFSVEMTGIAEGTRLAFPSDVAAESAEGLSANITRSGSDWRWSGTRTDTLRYEIPSSPVVHKSLGVFVVGGGVLVRPDRMLPRVKGRAARVTLWSQITSGKPDVASTTTHEWPLASPFIYAGPIVHLASGAHADVVAPDCGQGCESPGVRAVVDELAQAFDSIVAGAAEIGQPAIRSTLIVVPRSSFLGPDKLPYLAEHRSNLFLDPLLPTAAVVRRRIALIALEGILGLPDGRAARARLIGLADALCCKVHMERSIYDDAWSQDIALHAISELGIEVALMGDDDPANYVASEAALVHLLGALAAQAASRPSIRRVGPTPASASTPLGTGPDSPGFSEFTREQAWTWLEPRIRDSGGRQMVRQFARPRLRTSRSQFWVELTG